MNNCLWSLRGWICHIFVINFFSVGLRWVQLETNDIAHIVNMVWINDRYVIYLVQMLKQLNRRIYVSTALINLTCVVYLLSRLFIVYPKAIVRIAIVILNNIYCIPTYTIWMMLLLPLKWFNQKLYYKIEGKIFHWLLSVVAMWSWTAGYDGKHKNHSI